MPGFLTTVTASENHLAGTQVITLKTAEKIKFNGGNWVMVNTGIMNSEGRLVKRAYSIMSSDTSEDEIRLAVKRLENGQASIYLNELKVGMQLEISGPYGKNFFIRDDDAFKSIFFCATDTGITAVMGLLNGIKMRNFVGGTTIYWFRPNSDPFLSDEFVLSNIPDFFRDKIQIYDTAQPENQERYTQIRMNLESIFKNERPDLAFISGDGFSVRMVREMLLVCGLQEEQIRIEPFFNSDMKKVIPKDPAHLRTGYTTGACAAAAARAAARAAVTGHTLEKIETILPNGDQAVFYLKRCELNGNSALCSVIKDAGDDPDCTHLAELTAKVILRENPELKITGGEGVATVTKVGLGLEVGGPSITDVPKKNIIEMVQLELGNKGAEVIISVPGGVKLAEETTNARLGLIGGISILGTTGIVKPYSTAAFRRSIIQAIDVALESGITEIVVTTGGKTEMYGMKYFDSLTEQSFIQVGDFIGVSVRHSAKKGVKILRIFGMIGKLSKMADGVIQTHQKGSTVNMKLLADIAEKCEASRDTVHKILSANTARHVLDILKETDLESAFLSQLCRRIVNIMTNYAAGVKTQELPGLADSNIIKNKNEEFQITCHCIDFDGAVIGEFPEKQG